LEIGEEATQPPPPKQKSNNVQRMRALDKCKSDERLGKILSIRDTIPSKDKERKE